MLRSQLLWMTIDGYAFSHSRSAFDFSFVLKHGRELLIHLDLLENSLDLIVV